MPADNRSLHLDRLISTAADRWRGWRPGLPRPSSQVSPTEAQAGVGYYGTRPEHTADFHNAAAVLGGHLPHAVVSGDFFGASDVGRRLQSHLIAAGHSVVPAHGQVHVVRAKQSQPSRFAAVYSRCLQTAADAN